MEIPCAYRFLNIKINQFAYFDENFDRQNHELNIARSYSYGIDANTGHFQCVMSLTYTQNEKPVMKIETEAVYQLTEEGMERLINDNMFQMPPQTVRYFTSMLYGATRGILVCKLEGTPLVNIILPPDNLESTIDRPLVIPINEES